MSWELKQDHKPRLINRKYSQPYDWDELTYIGRGSIWGNPWVVKKGEPGSRAKAINNYKTWLLGTAHTDLLQVERQKILDNICRLKDKILVCYCSPLPCHGDVLLDLLDQHLKIKN